MLYFASDFEDDSWGIDSIAGDGDCFGESTDVVGVVADLYGTFLAGHDGLFCPCGDGAATACLDIAEDKRFVTIVGEYELAVAVAAFLEGAVVVFLLGKFNLGTVDIFGGGLNILCIEDGQRHADKHA